MTSIFIHNDSDVHLEGDLIIPELNDTIEIIIFAHGSGSGKNSHRNQHTRSILNEARFATLLIDLLTPEEQDADIKAQTLSHKIPGITLNKFNITLLARCLITITEWIKSNEQTQHYRIGYFGASTGAAAAFEAAAVAHLRNKITTIVTRGDGPIWHL